MGYFRPPPLGGQVPRACPFERGPRSLSDWGGKGRAASVPAHCPIIGSCKRRERASRCAPRFKMAVMLLNAQDLMSALRAFGPKELLAEYEQGVRDFSRINLLRPELERACASPTFLECTQHPDAERYNPLWVDYVCGVPGETDFHWDRCGHCLFDELEDLPEPCDLKGTNLAEVNLSGSYLYPIDFTEANLSRADLRRTIFIDSTLAGADLSRSDLRDAQFHDCNLTRANLYMARLGL